MRTTIEISDRHRSALLSLAAQRGLRGYSRIIEEALDFYIANQQKADEIKKGLREMKGSWTTGETEKIKLKLNTMRDNWKRS